MLILGYQNGVFALYRCDGQEFDNLQVFSVAQEKISYLTVNGNGAWIAFACKKSSQLMVWEWRSQTFILNQKGSHYDVTCLNYSPDGNIIAVGTLDGKLKLWDTRSYFCFSTTQLHNSKVTDVVFSPANNTTVLTCSLDGTVIAFDCKRYRVFRTMTTDPKNQLLCLAVDQSCDIVCAGGQDPYSVYCWNLQTGHLVDVIAGHDAPVTCLAFSPTDATLVSGSWDKTVRVHNLLNRKTNDEILDHQDKVATLCYRSDGKQIAVSTTRGEVYMWNVEDGQITGMLDVQRDLKGGRGEKDQQDAKNQFNQKFLKTMCYTVDGEWLIGGGASKNVCIYDLKHRVMVKKLILSSNLSLDGVNQLLNSKNIKDGMNVLEIDDASDESDVSKDQDDLILPGAKRPNYMKRNTKLRIEAKM